MIDRTIAPLMEAIHSYIKKKVYYILVAMPRIQLSQGIFNYRHNILYNSIGFKANDGTHIKNIEGFWGHMKAMMRKKNGVHRKSIDDWTTQHTF